jgi:hypothetical protein
LRTRQEHRKKEHEASREPGGEEHCVRPGINGRHWHPDGR